MCIKNTNFYSSCNSLNYCAKKVSKSSSLLIPPELAFNQCLGALGMDITKTSHMNRLFKTLIYNLDFLQFVKIVDDVGFLLFYFVDGLFEHQQIFR